VRRPEGHLEAVSASSWRGILGILYWAFVGVFFLLNLVTILVLFTREVELPPTTVGGVYLNFLVQGLLFVALPWAYLAVVRPHERVLDLLGLRFGPRTGRNLLIGLGVGLGAATFLILLGLLLDVLGVPVEETSPIIDEFQRLVRVRPELLLLIPLVAGVTEEVFFRGLLQPRVGLVASSALFGIVHGAYATWLQLVVPALAGLLLGYLYLRTRDLWAPIAAHFMFNFVQFVLIAMG
jgi:membrane protease YdiL (CAAX protease family)